jgi:glycosyltransferase involved in cell wall biosynthesis
MKNTNHPFAQCEVLQQHGFSACSRVLQELGVLCGVRKSAHTMRRVLLTVHKFFPEHKAGTEVLTLKVAQGLLARGYEVLVVTANPPDVDARHLSAEPSKDYVYEGVNIHSIEEALRLKGYTFKHEYYHAAIKEHFDKVLAQFKPDLVHIFHAQNLTSAIIDSSEQAGVPIVSSLTDFWFVCPVVQLKRPDGALCRGPSPGAINCLTCYTPELIPPEAQLVEAVGKKIPSLSNSINRLPKPLQTACAKALQIGYSTFKLPAAIQATVERPQVLRKAVNKNKAIMVPTVLMRDIFIENGMDAKLLHHVPFGLDTSNLAGHQTKTPSTALRIGFIGTIFEHKGLDLLIKAFQKFAADTPAVLRIYGDLNQFPEYGKTIQQLINVNARNIELCGTFPNAELGRILDNIDVLVVPSRWYENTPLVIQSALATKTPVVATNLGGMSELIKHEINGLLFELNDYESLHRQLKRLVDDRQLLSQFVENIPPERTIEAMIDDIEGIYEKVLKSDGSSVSEVGTQHPVSGIITSL